MFELLIIVITSFIITLIMTPVTKKIAHHVKALDEPNDRKVHARIIPRLGGLAIYFGFLGGFILFGDNSITLDALLISSFIIIITGIIDDIKPLPASLKFSGQLIAALIIMFYGGLQIDMISAFGYVVEFGFLTYPLTIYLH